MSSRNNYDNSYLSLVYAYKGRLLPLACAIVGGENAEDLFHDFLLKINDNRICFDSYNELYISFRNFLIDKHRKSASDCFCEKRRHEYTDMYYDTSNKQTLSIPIEIIRIAAGEDYIWFKEVFGKKRLSNNERVKKHRILKKIKELVKSMNINSANNEF